MLQSALENGNQYQMMLVPKIRAFSNLRISNANSRKAMQWASLFTSNSAKKWK